MSIIFRKNGAVVKRSDGSITMTARRQGQLYLVNGERENVAFNTEGRATNKIKQ